MLKLYSLNVEVGQNGSIPFNNISLAKGQSAVLSAPATIQFNRSGIYMVSVDASITPAAVGDVSIQLAKNGLLDQGSFSTATGAAGQTTTLGFTTLVQVRENNTCCCNTSPTTIQIINTGQAGTFPIVNMTVTKIC